MCTYAVGDDVRVAVQRALWVAVRGLVTGQVPDDESLIARGRKEHVRAVIVILAWYEEVVSTANCAACGCSTHFSRDVAREVTHPE